MGEGACQPDIFIKYRLGCELSYGTCPISLCAGGTGFTVTPVCHRFDENIDDASEGHATSGVP